MAVALAVCRLAPAKLPGGFRIGKVARAAVLYLVESAIDAISLTKLRTLDGEKGFAVVSTAGTTPEPRKWFADLADNVRRVCAFDNDKPGEEAARKLRRYEFERMRPTGKDWNDDLRARRAAAGGQGAAAPTVPAARPSEARKPPEPIDEGRKGRGSEPLFLFRGDSGGRAGGAARGAAAPLSACVNKPMRSTLRAIWRGTRHLGSRVLPGRRCVSTENRKRKTPHCCFSMTYKRATGSS